MPLTSTSTRDPNRAKFRRDSSAVRPARPAGPPIVCTVDCALWTAQCRPSTVDTASSGGSVKRIALVIGAQTGTLRGVHNDVATMTTLLADRDFTVDARTGTDATQAGIRDGYQRLTAEAADGDAVVVYFSGHGGLARVLAPDGIALPDLQFIVPSDYDESSA